MLGYRLRLLWLSLPLPVSLLPTLLTLSFSIVIEPCLICSCLAISQSSTSSSCSSWQHMVQLAYTRTPHKHTHTHTRTHAHTELTGRGCAREKAKLSQRRQSPSLPPLGQAPSLAPAPFPAATTTLRGSLSWARWQRCQGQHTREQGAGEHVALAPLGPVSLVIIIFQPTQNVARGRPRQEDGSGNSGCVVVVVAATRNFCCCCRRYRTLCCVPHATRCRRKTLRMTSSATNADYVAASLLHFLKNRRNERATNETRATNVYTARKNGGTQKTNYI